MRPATNIPGTPSCWRRSRARREVSMMLVAPRLRVIHVTTHMGLLDAIARIDAPLVESRHRARA